jgi:hypothetical protein
LTAIKLKTGGKMMASKIGILAVAAITLMVFAGFAVASPPVPPPEEGFLIRTSVDINCIGDVIEEEEFTWTWMNDPDNPNTVAAENDSDLGTMTLGFQGRAAQIRYEEDLRAIDSGAMQLNKQFTAQSDDEPNLDVEKDYAWAGQEGSGITNVSNRERAALSVVAMGDSRGLGDMPSLCPWVQGRDIPATNEFIAMGSRTTASGADGSMTSLTDTDATGTGPPSLNHTIHAEGVGSAEAMMLVGLMEGDAAVTQNGTVPNLISTVEYSEYTGAFGIILNFDKAMHYDATLPAWQMPEPYYMILDEE